MQNDDLTPEVELDENQIDMEETVEETADTTPETDTTDWKAEALKYKAIAQRKAKQVAPKAEQPLQTSNFLTREEGILIAKGMDDDTIGQLKVIAKGKGISLLEAEKDPLFIPYLEKIQKEKKSEQAKLGASKGSTFKQEKAEAKSGMSREEHMNLWKGKQ